MSEPCEGLGKNILGDSSMVRDGLAVFVGQWEACVTGSMSGRFYPWTLWDEWMSLPFPFQSQIGSPPMGLWTATWWRLNHILLVTWTSGVGMIWLKEKEGNWRCCPPSERLSSQARTHLPEGKWPFSWRLEDPPNHCGWLVETPWLCLLQGLWCWACPQASLESLHIRNLSAVPSFLQEGQEQLFVNICQWSSWVSSWPREL